MSLVFQNIDSPPPLSSRRVCTPRLFLGGGGYHKRLPAFRNVRQLCACGSPPSLLGYFLGVYTSLWVSHLNQSHTQSQSTNLKDLLPHTVELYTLTNMLYLRTG
jgi:hypothetical protein